MVFGRRIPPAVAEEEVRVEGRPPGRPRKEPVALETKTMKNKDIEKQLKEAVVEERREVAVDREESIREEPEEPEVPYEKLPPYAPVIVELTLPKGLWETVVEFYKSGQYRSVEDVVCACLREGLYSGEV